MAEASRDPAPPGNPFLDREDVLGQIKAAFAKRNPSYATERARLTEVLAPLGERLEKLQKDGNTMVCAEQIFLEIQWLLNYRDDHPRVVRRIEDLRRSLANVDQPDPGQDSTGSWGGCCEEWYRKLEPTVDALQDADPATIKPLKFMERLQESKRVLDYLYRLQISDIEATGRNDRDELSAVQTALSQLIFKKQLRQMFTDGRHGFTISGELEESYLDLPLADPASPYWLLGALVPLWRPPGHGPDLSFTFHVIQYRAGDIPNWPAVIESTLAIKDLTYPAGWRPGGGHSYNNHNNYDVVTIFRFGWPYMTDDQKARVATEIEAMLAWCLTRSVSGDGFLIQDESVVDAYYFGVRFLDRVGFWDSSKRFWSDTPPALPPGAPTPSELCGKLRRGFDKLNDTSEEAATVQALLEAAAA